MSSNNVYPPRVKDFYKNFSKNYKKVLDFPWMRSYDYKCKEQVLEERTEGHGYKAQAVELKSTTGQRRSEMAETAEFDECAVHHKMQDDEVN